MAAEERGERDEARRTDLAVARETLNQMTRAHLLGESSGGSTAAAVEWTPLLVPVLLVAVTEKQVLKKTGIAVRAQVQNTVAGLLEDVRGERGAEGKRELPVARRDMLVASYRSAAVQEVAAMYMLACLVGHLGYSDSPLAPFSLVLVFAGVVGKHKDYEAVDSARDAASCGSDGLDKQDDAEQAAVVVAQNPQLEMPLLWLPTSAADQLRRPR